MAGLGLVSRLDATARLLCLALLSSTIFFAGFPLAAVLVLLAALLLINTGLGLPTLLRELVLIALFALFSTALRMIGLPGAWNEPLKVLGGSALYCARLLAAFLVGRLFYASTSAGELREAATRICRRLPFLGRFDLGLGLALILGFIPLIFEEWGSSLEAARSRGLARRPRLSGQASFLAAFLRRLMLRAVAVPEALRARGWSPERGLVPLHWRLGDSIAVTACTLLLGAAALRLV